MEITPRRSLSLNLDTKNKYFGISPQIREMWTSQNIKTIMDTPTSCRMTHSLSMDDTRVNSTLEKKDTTLLKSMFGSLSSFLSKIPTLMSSINNPLSVTVVANEGIISPEYILKNLTQSTQESPDPMNLKQFHEIQETPIYNSGAKIAEIFAERVGNKFLQVKTWIEDLQEAQESINSFNESNDLDLAIQESLKHMKNQKEIPIDSDIDRIISTKIEKSMTEVENIDRDLINQFVMIDKITPGVSNSAEVVNNNTIGDKMESESPLKKYQIHKTRRKTCTIARGKTRGKYQLRKSGVSQSKHRKERTKQNLYSNIQDDLRSWEEVGDDSDDINCRLPIGERDNDDYHVPDYPMFIESYVLGEERGRRQRKGRRERKLGYRVRFLPEEGYSPIREDLRQRLISESSIDSEDSCCIVFEDESEFETDCSCNSVDYEFGESSEEEEEEEEEERTGQKVRFNLEPTVHTMIQWNYAYRAARRGPWEEMARDRERFRGRINCIGRVLDPILNVKHRECIWHDRFSVDESIKK